MKEMFVVAVIILLVHQSIQQCPTVTSPCLSCSGTTCTCNILNSQYFDLNDNTCKSCNLASLGNCLGCQSVINSGETGPVCNCPLTSNFINPVTGVCTPCDSGCLLCTGAGAAACTCKSLGKFVDSLGVCQSCDSGCLLCIGTGTSNCICPSSGHFIDALGVCKSCAAGCLSCTSATSCSCSAVKKFVDPTTNTCKSCAIECLTCSGPLSTDCICKRQGFYLDSSFVCQPCKAGCLLCNDGTSCSCDSAGNYVSWLKSKSRLLKYEYSSSDFQVSGSSFGPYCRPCPYGCATCTSSSCLTCSTGFYQVSVTTTTTSGGVSTTTTTTSCKSCSSIFTGCKECSSATACATCQSGYVLVSGSCVKCSLGCTTCTSATACTTCLSGYALISGSCSRCTFPCITCTTSTTNCQSCLDSGYVLTLTGGVGSCVACSNGCKTCTSSTTCSTCFSGYSLTSTGCVQCSSFCSVCSAPNFCTQCNSRFSLSNGKCCKRFGRRDYCY